VLVLAISTSAAVSNDSGSQACLPLGNVCACIFKVEAELKDV
jgi:hypothetical protein